VPQSALGGRAAASAQGAAWSTPQPELVHRGATSPPRTRRHAPPFVVCASAYVLATCIDASAHRRQRTNAHRVARSATASHHEPASASLRSCAGARTSSPCAAAAGRNDAPRPAQPHRRQRDAAHRRATPLTAAPHAPRAPRARRAPRHRHTVKVHVPPRQARLQPGATMQLALRGRARRTPLHRHAVRVHVPPCQARPQPGATMHLALRGRIGAAALVGHPRQRDAGAEVAMEHVTAEPV